MSDAIAKMLRGMLHSRSDEHVVDVDTKVDLVVAEVQSVVECEMWKKVGKGIKQK